MEPSIRIELISKVYKTLILTIVLRRPYIMLRICLAVHGASICLNIFYSKNARLFMEESVGFEPTVDITAHKAFQELRDKPLCQLSILKRCLTHYIFTAFCSYCIDPLASAVNTTYSKRPPQRKSIVIAAIPGNL